jgi:hypothetical protein
VARPGQLSIQDLASIPNTDSIHDPSVPASSTGRSELVEENQNRSVHREICQTQEQGMEQHDTHGDRLEYDWDNGPLELFPWDLVEPDYAPDSGPYSPGAFSLDESDPVHEQAYRDIVS